MALNVLIALSLLAALVEVKGQMCFSGSCGTNGLSVNSMEDCCLGDPLPTNSYYQPAGGKCHPCIVIGFDPVSVTISEESSDYKTTQILLLTDMNSLDDDYKDAEIELTVGAHTQLDNATFGTDFTIQDWSQPSTAATSFVLGNLNFDINIMAIDDEVLVEREEFRLIVTNVQYTVNGSVVHVAVANSARVIIEDNDVIQMGFSNTEIDVHEDEEEVQLLLQVISSLNLVTHFCVHALTYTEYNETYHKWLKDYPYLPTHSLTNEYDQAELEDFSTRKTCFSITADSKEIPLVKIKLIDDDTVEPVHEGFRVLIVVDESEMPISYASFKYAIQLALVRIDDYFDEITIGFLQETFFIKVEDERAIDLELQFDVISGSTEFPIIFTVCTVNETSTARSDYDYIPSTIQPTIEPPNTTDINFLAVTVITRPDNIFDNSKSIVVHMSNEELKAHIDPFMEGNVLILPDHDQIVLNPSTATIIILDSVEVLLTVPEIVNEGEAFFPTVTVHPPVNISFTVSVESDTAEVGLDFDMFNETVTLSSSENQTTTSIPIQTIMDHLAELTETFKVTIDFLEPSNLQNRVTFDKEFAPVNIRDTNSAPSAPSNLSSTSITDTTVSLSWTEPMSVGGRPDDLFYVIRYKTLQDEFVTYNSSLRIKSVSVTISGLSPNTIYTFVVIAENNVTQEFSNDFEAESRSSNEITVQTKQSGIPMCYSISEVKEQEKAKRDTKNIAAQEFLSDFEAESRSSNEITVQTEPSGSDICTTSTTSTSISGTLSLGNILASVFVSGFLSSAVTAVITSIVCLVIMRRRQQTRATTSKSEPTPIYDNIAETTDNETFPLKINAAYEHVGVKN